MIKYNTILGLYAKSHCLEHCNSQNKMGYAADVSQEEGVLAKEEHLLSKR